MRRLDVLRGWRERWKQGGVKPAARQLAAELLAGHVTTESPFGEAEGRKDLRGLQVDVLASNRDPMYERHGVRAGHWDALDLSGAGLSGLNWTEHRLTDCVLVDAQLDYLRCWGVEVVNCSAQRVSLRNAQIGAPAPGVRRSDWRRVDLRGADLRQMFGDVLLEDIDLRRARFGRTYLGWSDLNRIQFDGPVQSLAIGDLHADRRPNTWLLKDVDLTRARPRVLSLIGVNLGQADVDIRLPDDDEHWLIHDWPQFLARVAATAPDELRGDADIWVEHERHHLGPHQTAGFTTRRDAIEYAGEQFAALLETCR